MVPALSSLESFMASEQHAVADTAAAPGQVPHASLLQTLMDAAADPNPTCAPASAPGWWMFEILLHGALCVGFYFAFVKKPKMPRQQPGGEHRIPTASVSQPWPQSTAAQHRGQAVQQKAQTEKIQLSQRLNLHAIHGDLQQMTWTLEKIDKYDRHCLDMKDYQRVIVHLARGGVHVAAHKWLRRAVELGLQPQQSAFTSVIRGYVKARDYEQAKQVANEMKATGLKFDTITYNTMIHVCLCAGEAETGQLWMKRMLSEGVQPNAVTFATVMQICSSANLLTDLDKWFVMSQEHGCQFKPRTFDSMLGDFQRRDDDVNAMKWLAIMIEIGVQPDANSFHRVLNLLIKGEDVERVSNVIAMMRGVGMEHPQSIYNRCIVMAAANGHVSKAQQWADECIAANGKLTEQARQAMYNADLKVRKSFNIGQTTSSPRVTAASTGDRTSGCIVDIRP